LEINFDGLKIREDLTNTGKWITFSSLEKEKQMKKFYSSLIILAIMLTGIILFSPPPSKAQSLNVSFGLGTMLGGSFDDLWQSTNDFYRESLQPTKKSKASLEFYLELTFMFNDNFGLAIGGNYLNRNMTGSKGVFRFPEGYSIQGNFSYTPELTSSLWPIYANIIYSFPIQYQARMHVLAGIDYYFGRMRCYYDNLDFDFTERFSGWNYYAHLYETKNMKTWGYHFGLGVELELSENTAFVFEGIYRVAKFNDYSTKIQEDAGLPFLGDQPGGETQEGQKIFLYGQKYGGEEEWGDVIYSVNSLDLNTLSLRGGIKIRF